MGGIAGAEVRHRYRRGETAEAKGSAANAEAATLVRKPIYAAQNKRREKTPAPESPLGRELKAAQKGIGRISVRLWHQWRYAVFRCCNAHRGKRCNRRPLTRHKLNKFALSAYR